MTPAAVQSPRPPFLWPLPFPFSPRFFGGGGSSTTTGVVAGGGIEVVTGGGNVVLVVTGSGAVRGLDAGPQAVTRGVTEEGGAWTR